MIIVEEMIIYANINYILDNILTPDCGKASHVKIGRSKSKSFQFWYQIQINNQHVL